MKRLLDIMAGLRDPVNGCPWDNRQTFKTIVPYTLEEAYEVADAVAEDNVDALQEELGDLLFQVVFFAQIASEAGSFNFGDIARVAGDKMLRRHPHVFGDISPQSSGTQTQQWEAHKAREREARSTAKENSGILDGVPKAMPALTRALKLQQRAARADFDWPDIASVFDKLVEELSELRTEVIGGNVDRVREEFGDVLFSWVNLARFLETDPESALRHTNAKFERRFRRMESKLKADGRTPDSVSFDELEGLWRQVKEEELDQKENSKTAPV